MAEHFSNRHLVCFTSTHGCHTSLFNQGVLRGGLDAQSGFTQSSSYFKLSVGVSVLVVLLLSAAVIEITHRSSAGRRANGRPGVCQSASHAFFTLSSCPSTFTLLKCFSKMSAAAEAFFSFFSEVFSVLYSLRKPSGVLTSS